MWNHWGSPSASTETIPVSAFIGFPDVFNVSPLRDNLHKDEVSMTTFLINSNLRMLFSHSCDTNSAATFRDLES